MAHKTLIGGTAYEITGGKTLIDGTAYSIKSGKTLVNGTAYEVGFAPKEAIVTITRLSGFYYTPEKHLWLEIDGTKYEEIYTPTELNVPIGTVIECCYNASSTTNKIYLNETVIAEGMASYVYTVMGNISIEGGLKVTGGGMGGPGSVTERYFKITEQ